MSIAKTLKKLKYLNSKHNTICELFRNITLGVQMVDGSKTECSMKVTYLDIFLGFMARDLLRYAEHMCTVAQGWLSMRINHDTKTLLRVLSLSWKKKTFYKKN